MARHRRRRSTRRKTALVRQNPSTTAWLVAGGLGLGGMALAGTLGLGAVMFVGLPVLALGAATVGVVSLPIAVVAAPFAIGGYVVYKVYNYFFGSKDQAHLSGPPVSRGLLIGPHTPSF